MNAYFVLRDEHVDTYENPHAYETPSLSDQIDFANPVRGLVSGVVGEMMRRNPYWPVDTGASLRGFYCERVGGGRDSKVFRWAVRNRWFYAAYVELTEFGTTTDPQLKRLGGGTVTRRRRVTRFQNSGTDGPAQTWLDENLGALSSIMFSSTATLWGHGVFWRGRGGVQRSGNRSGLRQRIVAQANAQVRALRG